MRILYALVSALSISCSGCRPKPPDLTSCTLLRLRTPDGAISYFFSDEEGIFSAEEREHIRSFDAWEVEKPDVIKAFAANVSQGMYHGQELGETSPGLQIICYRNGVRVTSLDVVDGAVTTEDDRVFHYRQRRLNLSILEPPEIQTLKPRWQCALHISQLHVVSLLLSQRASSYAAPSQWCDAVVEGLRQQHMSRDGSPLRRTYSDAVIAKKFRCPVTQNTMSENSPDIESSDHTLADQPADLWVSDYAMNSNWEQNSPADMVLLFEAKAGWNRHGGPELFTFDNHDPSGGLVLLNDSTVKFIRTEEELKQLRWK